MKNTCNRNVMKEDKVYLFSTVTLLKSESEGRKEYTAYNITYKRVYNLFEGQCSKSYNGKTMANAGILQKTSRFSQ